MLITPGAPQLLVGRVCPRRDLVEQLFARDLAPIVRLQLEQEAALSGLWAGQQALILFRIEAAVRLELGGAGDPGRRRVTGELADLVICDKDAAAPILVLEQDLGHHLVEDSVFNTPGVVLGKRPAFAL